MLPIFTVSRPLLPIITQIPLLPIMISLPLSSKFHLNLWPLFGLTNQNQRPLWSHPRCKLVLNSFHKNHLNWCCLCWRGHTEVTWKEKQLVTWFCWTSKPIETFIRLNVETKSPQYLIVFSDVSDFHLGALFSFPAITIYFLNSDYRWWHGCDRN